MQRVQLLPIRAPFCESLYLIRAITILGLCSAAPSLRSEHQAISGPLMFWKTCHMLEVYPPTPHFPGSSEVRKAWHRWKRVIGGAASCWESWTQIFQNS